MSGDWIWDSTGLPVTWWPPDYSTYDDCMVLEDSGDWDNEDCDDPFSFICEIESRKRIKISFSHTN